MKPKVAALSYVALAVADTALAARPGKAARAARFVTKPMLMPALATAFVGATEGKGTLAKGVTTAQAFSWGGDVALLGKGDTAFLSGLSSFFVGHLGYVAAFASARERGLPAASPGVKAAGVVLATAAPVMAIAAGRQEPKLRAPVAAYSAVLASMFAASTRLDPEIPPAARRTIMLGTGLFLASDSILATREFLVKGHSHALDSAVMATYTAGQGLIALGAAQAAAAN